jgi:hypothetical protein
MDTYAEIQRSVASVSLLRFERCVALVNKIVTTKVIPARPALYG